MVKFKGFTLVELLIVIIIIGVLASALIPKVLGLQSRARDVYRASDISQINNAINMYQLDNNSLLPIDIFGNGINNLHAIMPLTGESVLSKYMKSIPKDPSNHSFNYKQIYWTYNTPFLFDAIRSSFHEGEYVYFAIDSGKSYALAYIPENHNQANWWNAKLFLCTESGGFCYSNNSMATPSYIMTTKALKKQLCDNIIFGASSDDNSSIGKDQIYNSIFVSVPSYKYSWASCQTDDKKSLIKIILGNT